MNHILRAGLLLVFSLALCGVAAEATASELTVPNTFTAGSRASAAQVNQNFQATATAVNDNNARVTDARTRLTTVEATTANHATRLTTVEQTVTSQGTRLTATEQTVASLSRGTGLPVFAGNAVIGYWVGTQDFSNDFAWLLSDKGYLFRMEMTQNQYLSEFVLFFSNANCSGSAYASPTGNPAWWILENGVVFRPFSAAAPAPVYYVARSAQPANVAYQSRLSGDQCQGEVSNTTGWVALPNDPAVTGVSNTAPARPLSLGLPAS